MWILALAALVAITLILGKRAEQATGKEHARLLVLAASLCGTIASAYRLLETGNLSYVFPLVAAWVPFMTGWRLAYPQLWALALAFSAYATVNAREWGPGTRDAIFLLATAALVVSTLAFLRHHWEKVREEKRGKPKVHDPLGLLGGKNDPGRVRKDSQGKP
jgi:hypothetical protein